MYYEIKNATAYDNWMYLRGEECASFLKTEFQASQVINIDTISVANAQIINEKPYLSFFSQLQIDLEESSTLL